MAESASRKGKKGEEGPQPQPQPQLRPWPRSMAIEKTLSGKNRKRGEYKPARLDQRNRQSGEDEPARLNQDMVKLVAESSTAEYAGTEGGRVEDELNRYMMKSEFESVYDVVLSFRGTDVGSGFADPLYHCLVADRIRVFRYDGSRPTTTKELRLSVYSSKIYVPIFSTNYAGNSRCLEALALMVEHTSKPGGNKEILPVFYNVDRYSLEKESLYRDALDTHKQSLGNEKVEKWKKALVEAGKVKGWELSSYKGGSRQGRINFIAREISLKLKRQHNHVPGDLFTGADPMLSSITSELQDSQKLEIMRLLDLEVNDIRIVGIHGRDGIGKTALAKIVYDEISLRFDACSFLAEIEETMQQPGGVHYLQTKFFFDILKREYEVASAFKRVRFLKEILRNMKVLIVLEDVERPILKEFVSAKLDWFGSGSRIIVTSKKKNILQGFIDRGLARTYDVIPMHHDLAFKFFWHCAIGKSDEVHHYVDVANKIVKAAKGLPLLLKVFGSFLHDKGLEEWNKFEHLIQHCQEDHQKILSIIYEALDQKQKQMYRDIACFPPDVDYRIASYMTHDYYGHNEEIRVLRCMSLIQMEENKISMHSMLRCLARKIIREGFHDPGTGVGLHIPAIAPDTIKGEKGTDHLNTAKTNKKKILPNTTFLSLGRTNIGGQFADLNVRWLHWPGCPQDAILNHLEKNENLVILDLSWSKVTGSWRGWERIKMALLKVLNLTGCADLLVTPGFLFCPNLDILILERCSRLVHLDPSINGLKHLATLNLKFCSELSMLPVEMGGMNALRELLIDGTSVRELPTSIGKLVRLQNLSATNCFSLVRVPSSVFELKSLSLLALDDAKILELPESIGDLKKLRRLSLRDCHELGKLPESMGELSLSLVELDISGTGISSLPDSIKKLWRLKVLKMDSCFLREFPRVIGCLFYLEEVHASWCRSLEGVIPNDISKLHHLRELRLRGTCISSLPSKIQFMQSLQTLDLLHCDNLKELPPLPSNLINLYVNPELMPKM